LPLSFGEISHTPIQQIPYLQNLNHYILFDFTLFLGTAFVSVKKMPDL